MGLNTFPSYTNIKKIKTDVRGGYMWRRAGDAVDFQTHSWCAFITLALVLINLVNNKNLFSAM